jgi:3-methyladenine DNA glycosylase Tag
LLPFLLLVGFLGYRGYIASTVGNEAYNKSKRAKSLSRKRLKSAEKLKSANHEADFYEEIQKAMSGFIADQFNIPQSEMSKERIASLFSDKEVPTDVSDAYLKVMSDAEFKRYAPSAGGSMSDIYDHALNAVINIQGHV